MREELKGRLAGTAAAVVGAGRSGQGAALLLRALGANVRLLEAKAENVSADFAARATAEGIEIMTGPHLPEYFEGMDMVVLSPGVQAGKIRALFPIDAAPEVISELELSGRYAKGRVLAITGTNGKTTTTALCAHVLRHMGLRVFEGGNIGTPLADHVLSGDEADALVLEVSSFQAQNCTTFRPEVAVLLNLSVDHQDFHADMEEYLQAKLNLFARMEDEDLAVLPAEMRDDLESRHFTRARLHFFEATDRFECDRLPGAHNQANMEAAFQALTRFGVTERDMREALDTFVQHPHRLERVGETRGVLFINDSKATTVASLKAALEAFDRPILLLAGGKYKGGDLEALAPLLKRRVRAVCLFGDSREVFEKAWTGIVPLGWEPNMQRAVEWLMERAEQGDVMLLSPATASYDLYNNYKERGEDLRRIFRELS
ncbi:UDP-N-acetylmuramoylalanine--D-glutamate ligase [Desulfobaculum xiamenense]|uniref:UDP-N-acetylmuramoylalanine--D-glutamate ligase n=1 Tax=Desulfobaculum xiamenense TaxID=995050 RepID=A0A846QRE0_9BACT|nr:UDP-N-acetylmuramoyl-L-alanine--D-glutamate ligase [Desulfobaculum xiamenense]NJB67764.1 UDP-N-acetylmuramoylalanine--D-glutamate ligase [Desulfobaculum xiamenense]